MILLASIAWADTGEPDSAVGLAPDTGGCATDRLVAFTPDVDEVPADVVLTAFFADCDSASPEYTARVQVGDVVKQETSVQGGASGAFTWATVPYLLQAGDDVELTLSHWSTQEQVVDFTATDDAFEPLAGPPTFDEVQWQTDGLPWVQVTAAESPYGPTFVEARAANGRVVATGVNEVGRATLRSESHGGGDFCGTLFQRDADGSWLEGDSFCEEEPPRCGGCSSGVGAASALAAMAAALLLRRRES